VVSIEKHDAHALGKVVRLLGFPWVTRNEWDFPSLTVFPAGCAAMIVVEVED
jgi:hypothetical protein